MAVTAIQNIHYVMFRLLNKMGCFMNETDLRSVWLVVDSRSRFSQALQLL